LKPFAEKDLPRSVVTSRKAFLRLGYQLELRRKLFLGNGTSPIGAGLSFWVARNLLPVT
jgi:hypothetical protein